jgi:coniferyl-aldehyde dehydrogenase
MMNNISANTNIAEADAELREILDSQRLAFMRQGFPDLKCRLDRLDRCVAMVVENQGALCAAVSADFGNRAIQMTRAADFFTLTSQVKYIKKRLGKWMKTVKRRPDFPFNLTGAKAYLYYQPLGVIGILSPWNGPVGIPMAAVVDALSAGNRVMLKASENAPRTAELLKSLVAKYFSPDEFTVITGEAEVATAFTRLPFDHIMYTGGPGVARHVMHAAADNLVPVTLELGGKCPVIINSDADIEMAAQKVVGGRSVNSGQACISPDYVLLPKNQVENFIKAATATIAKMYPTILDNPDYASIINQRHYERICSYVDEAKVAGCRVIELNPANEALPSAEKRIIPPTLVVDPPAHLKVINEEIFGPVQAIVGYDSLDQAIEIVNSKPRPLTTYFFGNDKAAKDRVLAEIYTGGTTINDVYMGTACTDLPFGGVGNSGMGRHMGGDSGFKTFSNEKAVFEQGWAKQLGAAFNPPYGKTARKFLDGQLGPVKDR